MKLSTTSLFLGAVAIASHAEASHISVRGTRRTAPRTAAARSISKRSNLWGAGSLTDQNDIQYRANITLGGAPFSVIVDTGR